ncbi:MULTISPECIES: DUF3152 domain-containing protein [Micromonospora]|uniref:DUF3152 domain-containing protein n=1 Tax=Micromonospora TaxID=1873 RepID=UPI001E395541|nr:DUF3152 domain-containing protein [Verrucosispora sp. ts21]
MVIPRSHRRQPGRHARRAGWSGQGVDGRAGHRPKIAARLAVLVAVSAGVMLVAGGTGWLPGAADADEVQAVPPPVAAVVPPAAPQSSVPSSPEPPVVTPSPTAPVLQQPGRVPSGGRGRFDHDERTGPVLGRAGGLQRYRVAVESGAGVDPAEFGLAVQVALTGPGSWVDSGRLRLRQVETSSRYDFTVYLATAATAGRMCAAGGVDIRVGGRPYTSCRAPGKVIINLERWRRSVPHFVEAKVPLSVYRTYVINHEVGHQLGNRHERCPGPGKPAPVMMQQTLFLKGCVANPWPYLDGRRYAGPPL